MVLLVPQKDIFEISKAIIKLIENEEFAGKFSFKWI